MGKYNIINKSPEGNKLYKDYIVKYQVNNDPKIYEVDMVCIKYEEEIRYAFLEQPNSKLKGENPMFIDTKEDREEFVQEIKKYQMGSSYRKTHPIAYSEKDKLKNEMKELQKRISEIELKERNDRIKDYKNKIKLKEKDEEYNKLKSKLEEITLTNYKLTQIDFGTITRICLVDKENNLPISYLSFGKFIPLSDYDIEILARYDRRN